MASSVDSTYRCHVSLQAQHKSHLKNEKLHYISDFGSNPHLADPHEYRIRAFRGFRNCRRRAWAAVPEAAIDEHTQPHRAEDEVGIPGSNFIVREGR
jgi:DNA polymerase II small subunit/DNA polymerase delta subunit B